MNKKLLLSLCALALTAAVRSEIVLLSGNTPPTGAPVAQTPPPPVPGGSIPPIVNAQPAVPQQNALVSALPAAPTPLPTSAVEPNALAAPVVSPMPTPAPIVSTVSAAPVVGAPVPAPSMSNIMPSQAPAAMPSMMSTPQVSAPSTSVSVGASSTGSIKELDEATFAKLQTLTTESLVPFAASPKTVGYEEIIKRADDLKSKIETFANDARAAKSK